MAHLVESAFFVGQPAWHGVGTVLQDPPTTGEALIAAKLNWKIIERPCYAFKDNEETNPLLVKSHKVLLRSSDYRPLGVVSKKYTPLQNEDAFTWFDPLIREGHVKLEAAGSIKHGKRIWILAKIVGLSADVSKKDPVEAYLLLFNGHTGTLSVGVQFTCIRVVCNNTLTAALKRGEEGKEAVVRIRHSGKVKEALEEVRQVLNVSKNTFELSYQQYRKLMRKKLPIDGLQNYVREVFDVPEQRKDMPRFYEQILKAYEEGPGADLPGVKGTYWGAYNAVTHWLDHTRGKDVNVRLENTWLGGGKLIRDRAFEVALAN